MPAGSLLWELSRIRKQLDRSTATGSKTVKTLAEDPAATMALAGLTPDLWQTRCLCSSWTRALILASRQSGKSQVAAALAAHAALTSGALVLLLSPSQRQSVELYRKVIDLMTALDWPVPPLVESLTRLELVNGARVISLPGSEATVRSYSAVDLLIVDEAARVSDDLYRSVRPMLAVSGGRMLAVSSAYLRSGWFYESWVGSEPWERVKIVATECPRISPEFLEEERQALGERWFGQEYLGEFSDLGSQSFFNPADIDRAFSDDVKPLFVEE